MTKINIKNTNKYSKFWVDSKMFSDNTEYGTQKEKSLSDIMRYASYKRAISNFVKIISNQNIPVKFSSGNQSYTDGNTVVISAKMDENEFDPTVGLALHEASHIKLTDFGILKTLSNNPNVTHSIREFCSKYNLEHYIAERSVLPKIKDLLNWVEDRRIDNYIYKTSPGYKGYYQSLYDKYFYSSVIDKGLQSKHYRTTDWDSYMFRIINLMNTNSDLNALPGLKDIYNLVDLSNIGRLKSTKDALDIAIQIYDIIESYIPAESSNNQNSNSSQSSSGDSTDTDGSDSKNSKSDDSNETESDTGEGSDGDDSNGDNYDITASGSGKSKDNDSDTSSNNNSDLDDSDNDLPELTDKQLKSIEKAIEQQNNFINGDIKKSKLSKKTAENVDTISDSDISEILVGPGGQNIYGRTGKTKTIYIKTFDYNLVQTNQFYFLSTYSILTNKNQTSIDNGFLIGTMLGKKLKLRSEEKTLVTPRNKSGKISRRMLYELGTGNFNVFDTINITNYKPAIIHISIDASSSMIGNKWEKTQTAAVAIAKAASMVNNLDVVISYRSTVGRSNSDTFPVVMIAYDSRKDKISKIKNLFKYIIPNASTPEGLCFEAIMNDIIKTSNGIDSYFINFSDGEPVFTNVDIHYTGIIAETHTRAQIDTMKKAGINVLSYFISNSNYHSEYTKRTFNNMYGNSAAYINVNDIIQLAKTINSMFV